MRLVVYRRIAAARTDGEIADLGAEFADRFGPPPEQLGNLLLHQRLRRRAEAAGIVRVRRTALGWELAFDPQHPGAHAAGTALVAAAPAAMVTPAGVVRLPSAEPDPVAAVTRLAELLPIP